MDDFEKKQEALKRKTFHLMFQILIIFGAPAFAAYWAGKWLDTHYDMRPYGSLAAILAAFLFSWSIVIRIYIKLDREFRALNKEHEEKDQKS